MKETLKYAVIGAGGTGGSIAGYLTEAGKDVTVIARGAVLAALRENGLTLKRPDGQHRFAVSACAEEEYRETPDIIFVCVKSYSLESVYPLLRRAAGKQTAVVPILNVYGTGEKIARDLPGIRVLNGCIYISAFIEEPGVICMTNTIFRIIYGQTDGRKDDPLLLRLEAELREAGIQAVYSEHIRRDTLQKYAMVSPFAAAGVYFDTDCSGMQKPGEARDMVIACIREIAAVAEAMGNPIETDAVEVNLRIIDELAGSATSSMYKDWKKGGASEMDGLLFEMVRLGRRYGVPVPCYEKIAEKFGFRE